MGKLSSYAKSIPQRFVPIEIAGETFALRLEVNDLIAASSLVRKSTAELIADLTNFETARALLWAGLRSSDPDLSLEDAGRIVGELRPAAVAEKLAEAIEAAFPPEDGGTDP